MRIEQLRPDQLNKLATIVGRQRDYLARVRDRMRSLGFSHTDRLLDAVTAAHSATSNLVVVAASEAARRERKPAVIEPKPFMGR